MNTDIKKSIKECNAGDAQACSHVAFYYSTNNENHPDDKKAFKYYKKACELGYTYDYFILASLYQHGRGTEQNNKKAIECHRKACGDGNPTSCFFLADCCLNGKEDDGNRYGSDDLCPSNANYYYQRSCNLGNNASCTIYHERLADEAIQTMDKFRVVESMSYIGDSVFSIEHQHPSTSDWISSSQDTYTTKEKCKIAIEKHIKTYLSGYRKVVDTSDYDYRHLIKLR